MQMYLLIRFFFTKIGLSTIEMIESILSYSDSIEL